VIEQVDSADDDVLFFVSAARYLELLLKLGPFSRCPLCLLGLTFMGYVPLPFTLQHRAVLDPMHDIAVLRV
jgi:hypothetical protein